MLRSKLIVTAVATGILGFSGTYACAEEFSTRLVGFNENPSILSDGSGTFKLLVDKTSRRAKDELTYSWLSTAATQGDIHVARSRVNRGVIGSLVRAATNPRP